MVGRGRGPVYQSVLDVLVTAEVEGMGGPRAQHHRRHAPHGTQQPLVLDHARQRAPDAAADVGRRQGLHPRLRTKHNLKIRERVRRERDIPRVPYSL